MIKALYITDIHSKFESESLRFSENSVNFSAQINLCSKNTFFSLPRLIRKNFNGSVTSFETISWYSLKTNSWYCSVATEAKRRLKTMTRPAPATWKWFLFLRGERRWYIFGQLFFSKLLFFHFIIKAWPSISCLFSHAFPSWLKATLHI